MYGKFTIGKVLHVLEHLSVLIVDHKDVGILSFKRCCRMVALMFVPLAKFGSTHHVRGVDCSDSFFLYGGSIGRELKRKWLRLKFKVFGVAQAQLLLTSRPGGEIEIAAWIFSGIVSKCSIVFAYSSIGFGESCEHVLIASLFLVLILLDFLLGDGDLIEGRFVFRFLLENFLEVCEGFLSLAKGQEGLAATEQGFDAFGVQAEGFVALKF